ncbi:hypothetical protein CF557_10970 [Gallibacterium anatis]|nr:hypothetical protein [Gallibacterium anatis]WAX71279.1 hypothetical protein CF557_10970 [Gallibacterium anatis]
MTAEEQQQLKDAQAEVQKAKDEAQQIINNLPKREQSSLQKNLDKVKGIEVPEVTKDDPSDQNTNNPSSNDNHTSSQGDNKQPSTILIFLSYPLKDELQLRGCIPPPL